MINMKKVKEDDIERLRRLIDEGEAFVKKAKAHLKKLEEGEGENHPLTSSKKQKREALIKELLETGRRVKKKDIQDLS